MFFSFCCISSHLPDEASVSVDGILYCWVLFGNSNKTLQTIVKLEFKERYVVSRFQRTL